MLLIIFTLGFVFHCLYTAVLLVLVLLWVGASKKAAVINIIALDYMIIFMLLHWVVNGDFARVRYFTPTKAKELFYT